MRYIAADSAQYPSALLTHLGADAPSQLTLWGKFAAWPPQTLALFCSTKAPASILLTVHDLAQQWRHQGPTILSGFQSPVEEEALTVMLRGPQPVMLWLARGMVQRPLAVWRTALDEGYLLLVSPFANSLRRATGETALLRNRIIAATADAVLFAHAAPHSKTEALAREVLGWGKPVYTLAHVKNENLLALGAQVMAIP